MRALPGYTIRDLSEGDIPLLRELAIKIFRATFSGQNSPGNMERFLAKDYSLESFQSDFEENGSRYFFAMNGGTPAGYMRLRRNHEVASFLGYNTMELHRLYVDMDHQGQGVGALLMERALTLAAETNVDWIWLGVWEHNLKAQHFYQKWGFERFSEHVFQMGDEAQIDWLMRKPVTAASTR